MKTLRKILAITLTVWIIIHSGLAAAYSENPAQNLRIDYAHIESAGSTNELNNQQQLFTVEGNQLLRPELFLAGTYANRDFYADYIGSGVTRSVGDGLAVEIGQMGVELYNAIANDPGAFAQSVGEGILTSLQEFAADPLGSIADGVSRAGQTIGEGNAAAWGDSATEQLNALYGQDVSGVQQTLAALNTAMAGFTAVGVGKLGGALTRGHCHESARCQNS